MKTQARFLVAALATLPLTSCVYMKQPLTDDNTSTLDERLIGKWEPAHDKGKGRILTIGRKQGTKNTLEFVEVKLDDDQTVTAKRMPVYATRSKQDYLSMEGEADKKEKLYLICKYEFVDDRTWRFYRPDQEFFETAVETGRLQGSVERPESVNASEPSSSTRIVMLTDSPERIEAVLDANGAKCFDDEPKTYVKLTE